MSKATDRPFFFFSPRIYIHPSPHPICARSAREKGVFVSEILATVGLPETYDAGWVEASGLCGAAGGDAEAEGRVGHIVDDDTLVARAVVRPAADVGLDDIAAVKEGHFAIGLDPQLVPRMLG